MRFKVGDVVVKAKHRTEADIAAAIALGGRMGGVVPLGLEGTIVRPARIARGMRPEWFIVWADGNSGACAEYQLDPKRPPAFERGSWSEISRTVGWSPTKEIA